VALGDGGLVQEEVVVVSAAHRVVAGPQEVDLFGQVAAEDLEHRDRQVDPALNAAGLVKGVVLLALGAFHPLWIMPEDVPPGQS
jgi:hypothetical protein